MFNQRQIEILLELCENSGNYVTASYFAKVQSVSLRTIQNDISVIKSGIKDYPCVEFQSVAPKGSRIVVKNLPDFASMKEKLYHRLGAAATSYQGERTGQILLLLLKQHRAISLYDLENIIFVSRSTLLNDLKRVAVVLQKYDLELLRGSNKVAVDGSEVNKRRCLLGENLLMGSEDLSSDALTKIKNALVETFASYKHNVSESELNNAIVLLNVTVQRMQEWFFIDAEDLMIDQQLNPEREQATAIFERLTKEFYLRVPETEINYFALYMKGQGSFSATPAISQEVDELVLDGLREIRSKTGIDLTNDVNLRVSLALHCTSLIVRVKYDMQLKNPLVDYIRQNYPQGYDIATYFASVLHQRFHKKLWDGEIAFLAIHLYQALLSQQNNSGTKKVLVISSLRRSESILLRQTLLNWFSDQIAELFFIPPSEMNETYLERYDTFLSTEKSRYYEMGLALYINQFPNQQDYLNIKLAMDGFNNASDILQIFHRDLFVIFHQETERDEILRQLSSKSSLYYHLDGLYEAVMEREKIGSTFFGNGIAAAHPIFAVSSDTFVAIGISPVAVPWDADGNQVHLIMLVNVGKNNSKAFQLWNYLSKIISDRHFVSRLLPNPSYENFLKLLKDAITDKFES